jgi:two-component system response regulator FlrC
MKQYDVLIVEDDVALCEALNDTLELEGYRVQTAKNGTEAMSLLGRYGFRLVVSDVQMPVMDGLALLQNMQQQYEQMPVLLMTAYGTIPKAVEAMQAGAADYLIKPFEAKTLVEKVNALMVSAPQIIAECVVNEKKKSSMVWLVRWQKQMSPCCWRAKAARVKKLWPVIFIVIRIITPDLSRR